MENCFEFNKCFVLGLSKKLKDWRNWKMKNYFRIAAYYAKEDLGVIMDSAGMFDKLWEFSALLVQKGLKVIEVSTADKFLDGNISKVDLDNKNLYLRAYAKGMPRKTMYGYQGTEYSAIESAGKVYVPDKTITFKHPRYLL